MYFSDLTAQVLAWSKKIKSTPWVFLSGPLGAGKTTFTSELLKAFQFDASEVQSPTFLKLIAYENNLGSILHMDAYRVEDSNEFLRLGLEDYQNVILGVVEWPDRFEEFLEKYPSFMETLDIKNVLRIELGSDHKLVSCSEDLVGNS